MCGTDAQIRQHKSPEQTIRPQVAEAMRNPPRGCMQQCSLLKPAAQLGPGAWEEKDETLRKCAAVLPAEARLKDLLHT